MTDRLCVLDVGSTLITSEPIDLLLEEAGAYRDLAAADAASRVTPDAADLGPDLPLPQRLASLKGLPVAVCDAAVSAARFTPGAQNLVETLHGRGWVMGLVSEGFVEVVGPLAARLGITLIRACSLESIDGYLTGATSGPIVDSAAKAEALRNFAEAEGVSIENTVAIGSEKGDLELLDAAGLGIAFKASPEVQEAADVVVTSTRLDAVLEALGD